MRVESFLERRAVDSAEKTALISGERRLTYRELDDLATVLAHRLRALGLRRGDRVAVFMENCPEAVVTIFAVLKADGVFVMINPTTKTQKLSALLFDCNAESCCVLVVGLIMTNTPSALSTAKIVTTASGQFSMNTATRSPRRNPSARRRCAR